MHAHIAPRSILDIFDSNIAAPVPSDDARSHGSMPEEQDPMQTQREELDDMVGYENHQHWDDGDLIVVQKIRAPQGKCAKGHDERSCTIGSMNVMALPQRIAPTLELAEHAGIDVLCILEAGVSRASRGNIISRAN